MIPAASLLLVLQMISSSTSAQLGGCPTMCGNVSVPYPFGIGANCSLPGFDLTCDDRSRLLLGDKLQVVEISLANSTVRVLDTSGAMNITLYHSGSGGTPEGNGTWVGLGSSSGTFVVSEQHNQLVLTGCNAHATLRGDNRSVIAGCSSFCSVEESSKFNDPVLISTTDGTAACSGVRCCQTPIRVGRPKYTVEFKYLDPNLKYKGKLPVTVRIAERGWFDGVAAQMLDESAGNDTRLTPVPVVLDWALEATREVPEGNYTSLITRCPSTGLSVGLGVGSGAGLLLAAIGATFFTRRIKRRRDRLLRQQFFKQNRGHLLQQLVSQNADIAERMIIPLVELDKATNNFDKAREIGGGGHGTVYKEVPILVYEFISNGTLYHHLHVDGPAPLPWNDRLRIATETARAIAYLHSAVAFPIIHRDIKSHNILLDGSLTAKVSDFGASRCIPADRTGITTVIQGTLGYLDPMYYHTGRLTEKSNVYSFGVVLIELLTRKKPYSYRSSENDSLVAHFTRLLGEGNLVHIVDPQIIEEEGKGVNEVAALASICVNLEADDRPTMRQVEMTLENIQASSQQVLLPGVGTKIPKEEKQLTVSYPIIQGSKESSRQYSLEEEFLLSARVVMRIGDRTPVQAEGGGFNRLYTKILVTSCGVVAHPPCDLHFTAVYRPCDAILCSNALRSKRMISYETPSFYTIAPGDPIHRAASQQALAGSHCYGNTRKAPVASYVPVDTML
ncbi:hypothetical protein PR202_ga23728 [Eleusine coracana subsp. coracana]|uniref:Protein kinase domain-containing protein n=1 Tax=Eleusine coracana subsp. coracana TaxID=191504 RepID=A0AAV5D500_ELECO|nr:hypothetical protein PR202_ga23728 [Eleusine coracana subsp. coracana]